MSKSEEMPQNTPNDINEQLLQQQLLQQQLLIQNNQSTLNQEDEIDLAELWGAIWAGKITIVLVSLLFAVASVFFALSQPNIYKASTILSPVSADSGSGGLGALAGQFGGLASMAGINLGGSTIDKTALALEILQSRSFLEAFIEKHNLLIPLMASNDWDMSSDSLVINEKMYDVKTNKWLREVKAPQKPEPSAWEAYKAFLDLLSVSQDKVSSMVTIELEFYSPSIAKQWLTWLVNDINEFMREEDKKEANASIEFLTNQLANIKIATMEVVFYQLIEEQTKNMMLTMVKKEYVLKTIDPAQVPDTKDKPKRALIVVLGTMLGGILSILLTLIVFFTKKKK